MEHKAATTQPATAFSLPTTVITLIDLGRLQRELEAVELFMAQASIRAAGTNMVLPRTTKNLELTCSQNKLNLLTASDRQKLGEELKLVRAKAPKVHISFAADPSAAFLGRVVTWFRTTVHPLTILQVGLQPTIAAGCVIRTSNKYFDLSLRKDFDRQTEFLTKVLHEQRQMPIHPPPKPVPVTTTGTGEKATPEYSFSKPVPNQTPATDVATPAQEGAERG